MKNIGKTGITGNENTIGSQNLTQKDIDVSSTIPEEDLSYTLYIEKPDKFFTDEKIEELKGKYEEFYYKMLKNHINIGSMKIDTLNLYNRIIEQIQPSEIEDFGTYLFYRQVINGYYMSKLTCKIDRYLLCVFVYKYQGGTSLFTNSDDMKFFDFLVKKGILN